MPRDPNDWSFTHFASPESLRKEAEKWDSIGNGAELDGDIGHAEASHQKASSLRQKAREKEADEEIPSPLF